MSGLCRTRFGHMQHSQPTRQHMGRPTQNGTHSKNSAPMTPQTPDDTRMLDYVNAAPYILTLVAVPADELQSLIWAPFETSPRMAGAWPLSCVQTVVHPDRSRQRWDLWQPVALSCLWSDSCAGLCQTATQRPSAECKSPPLYPAQRFERAPV